MKFIGVGQGIFMRFKIYVGILAVWIQVFHDMVRDIIKNIIRIRLRSLSIPVKFILRAEICKMHDT